MGIALITNNILSDSGTAVAGLVPTSRTISTTAPLTGGGDLSADRTIAIPAATSTVNGYLSATDWTTFNAKQAAGNYVTLDTIQTVTARKTFSDLVTLSAIQVKSGAPTGLFLQSFNSTQLEVGATVSGTTYYSTLTFPGSSRAYTFPSASGTIALTSDIPSLAGYVTGSGTTNYVPKFTGASTIGNSQIFDNGTNVLIGTTSATPGALEKLRVVGSTGFNGVVRIENDLNQGDVNHGSLMMVNNAPYAIGNDASIGFALRASGESLDPRASIGAKTESSYGGALVFNTRSDAGSYTEKVRISSIGNLGVGTPTPNSYSHGGSNRSIEIRNSDTSSNAQSHVILTTGATANTGSIGTISWALSNTAGNKLGSLIASNIVINSTTNAYTNLAFYTANGAGPSYAMQITNTGNLLINTSTDVGYKLDVNGTGRFVNSVLGDRFLTTINTANSTLVAGGIELQSYSVNNSWIGENIYFNGSAFYSRNTGYVSQIYFENNGDIALKTSASSVSGGTVVNSTVISRLVIKANGNIGIGIDNPTGTYGKLSVAGGISILNDNNAKFEIGRYSSGASNSYIKLGASSNALNITNNNDTVDIFTILNSGNVGIGNTGASNLLTIGQNATTHYTQSGIASMTLKALSGSARGMFEIHSADNAVRLVLQSVSGYGVNLGSLTASDLHINNPSGNITLKAGGNVLIGSTTDTGYKLQVAGTSTFSGQFIQGGGAARSSFGSTIAFTGSSQSIWSANTDCGDGGRFFSIVNELTSTNAFAGISFRVNPGGGSNNAMLDMKFVNSNNNNASTLYWSFLSGGSFFDRMSLTSGGNLTASAFFESSDKTIKTLITDNYQAKGIESVVAKLYTKNGREELGYYAQDVQGILPSAVSKGSDGLLSLSYREVHTAKIARLEKEVEELKAKLN